MEFEYEGSTYYLEWDSPEEIYVTDEDGIDIPYDYGLYSEAEELVLDDYIGRAEMMMDMAKDAAMGL